MENLAVLTALTFSVGALFQTLISVNNQQQQIVLVNSNQPQIPEKQEDNSRIAILMLIGGLIGLIYMFAIA